MTTVLAEAKLDKNKEPINSLIYLNIRTLIIGPWTMLTNILKTNKQQQRQTEKLKFQVLKFLLLAGWAWSHSPQVTFLTGTQRWGLGSSSFRELIVRNGSIC